MNDPYKTCYGCSRRLTGGENCHNAEYCPGWGYREEQKKLRYRDTELRVQGQPEIGRRQLYYMRKKVRQDKMK